MSPARRIALLLLTLISLPALATGGFAFAQVAAPGARLASPGLAPDDAGLPLAAGAAAACRGPGPLLVASPHDGRMLLASFGGGCADPALASPPARVVARPGGFAAAWIAAGGTAGGPARDALRVARLDGAARTIDETELADAPAGAIAGADLAAGAGPALGVAWIERGDGVDRVAFAALSAPGEAPARALLDTTPGARAAAPRVAWDAWRAQWVVLWIESAADGAPALRAARLDARAALVAPVAPVAPPVAVEGARPASLAIATGDGVLAVALETILDGATRAELRLLALDADGRFVAVAPPLALAGEADGDETLAPALAWDGLRGLFLAAWIARPAAAPGAAERPVALRLAAFDAAGRAVQRPIELDRGVEPAGGVALTAAGGRPLALWGAPDAALAAGLADGEEPDASGPPPGPLPLLDCTPADELCDGTDNDCDGSVDEETGPRFVAPTGSDAGNLCTVQAAPCATIGRAVAAACAGETVDVAEGTYAEDVTIDKPLVVDASGIAINTQLTGSNTRDVLRILSPGVTWDGIEVSGAPGFACVRIGDAARPGLRDIFVQNMAAYGCGQGILLDSTGVPVDEGQWNRLLAVDLRDAVASAAPDSGIGLLAVNGNGKLEIKVSLVRNNAGSGVRVKAPGPGGENRTIVFAGDFVQGNGFAPIADGRAGIEIAGASDVRFEGNEVSLHTGSGSGDDGRGIVLTDVASGAFYCNRIRQNDTGLNVRGSTGLALQVEQSRFLNHGFAGVLAEAPALLTIGRSILQGNAIGLENRGGTVAVVARENWWGAASGPAPGGTGNAVVGLADTGGFIARATAPWLVRRPADSGWDSSPDLCYQRLQAAIDAAADGELVLAGPGTYTEHLTLTRPVDIDGTAAPAGCPLTVLDATQDPGQHLPGMRVTGVSGLSLKNLTIRSAGEGNPCGAATGDEIGLDLVNVSNAAVTNLCLSENGVTELRLYGNSDGNTFTNLTIDGMIRNFAGEDACGHRSREGILVDGGPVCEGGPGAFAEGNVFLGGSIVHVVRGAALKLARSTELNGLTIDATPAPLWGTGNAYGVLIGLAEDTLVEACTLASALATDQVRIEGRDAASCVTELTDSARTTVSNSTLRRATQAGIHFHRGSGDPGSPVLSRLRCNEITQNVIGVLADVAGIAPASDNALTLNNVRGNSTNGVRNNDIPTLDALGNFWGATNGPSGAGPGNGDSVSGSVTFSPWLTSSVFNDFDGDTYSECGGDCNDTVASIRPGATELCDGIDNDCDGSVDEGGLTRTWYRDLDEDGFGDPTTTQVTACGTPAPPGFVANDQDCDDGNAARFPGNPEVCDAIDNDCDATVDEGLPQNTYYRDADGDGYGNPGQTRDDCAAVPPPGYVAAAGDCNDADRAVNPGATEICTDAVDNDCDGSLDAQDTPCSGLGVTDLRFAAGTRTDLTWSTAPAASSYAVLRGALEGDGFAYNHRCLASELVGAEREGYGGPGPRRGLLLPGHRPGAERDDGRPHRRAAGNRLERRVAARLGERLVRPAGLRQSRRGRGRQRSVVGRRLHHGQRGARAQDRPEPGARDLGPGGFDRQQRPARRREPAGGDGAGRLQRDRVAQLAAQPGGEPDELDGQADRPAADARPRKHRGRRGHAGRCADGDRRHRARRNGRTARRDGERLHRARGRPARRQRRGGDARRRREQLRRRRGAGDPRGRQRRDAEGRDPRQHLRRRERRRAAARGAAGGGRGDGGAEGPVEHGPRRRGRDRRRSPRHRQRLARDERLGDRVQPGADDDLGRAAGRGQRDLRGLRRDECGARRPHGHRQHADRRRRGGTGLQRDAHRHQRRAGLARGAGRAPGLGQPDHRSTPRRGSASRWTAPRRTWWPTRS